MAQRRTRKEKRAARQRRQVAVNSTPSDPASARQSGASPTTPQTATPTKTSSAELKNILRVDVAVLRRDILKSVGITLLLLGVIFGIVIYLRLI